MTFRKAWKDGNRSAYDRADSIVEAEEAYKRCRKPQHFILSPEGLRYDSPLCAGCHKPVKEDEGNRCIYYPKQKVTTVHHYECAWGQTFGLLEKVLNNR